MTRTAMRISYPDIQTALYGKDPSPGLVALHPEGDQMHLYFRRNGAIETEVVPWYPFFFVKDLAPLRDFPRQALRVKRLEGPGAYRYVVAFMDLDAYEQALRHLEASNATAAVYRIPGAIRQYLMQSGRTLFKGMTFDNLHRLQLDIEVYPSQGFPVAEREADRIILIALSDNRGWSHVIDGRELSEAEMLARMVALIQERDPDVIEGHNLFRFDWPYLQARSARHGIPLALGRRGEHPRTYRTSMRFAERILEFDALSIPGRHVIDTLLLVMAYDVFKRDLPGYGLKTVARYFGFATSDRTYVEGRDIARVWDTEPERLYAYALDDVRETEKLARHLSGSAFYLTQMIPMSYEEVARSGPAAKIESLFVREYLRCRRALPEPGWGSQQAGGYTDIFVTGVLGPILYVDVESLYPSIMLAYNIYPRKDHLRLFPALLRELTDLRLQTKREMKAAASPEKRSELDARQASYKILINSFYGMLGFSHALFNDVEAADRVALTGQQVLRTLIEAIQEAGGEVIEVDTDGVLFVPPPDVRDAPAEAAFVERLHARMPEGIRLGLDGRFQKMLSYKKKNYALLDYAGTITYRGSSLVSRSVERFGRQFVRQAIACLLHEDIEGLHACYMRMRTRILTHDWTVWDFSRTETLRESLEQYEEDVAAGRRPRAAAYELALHLARERGRPIRRGDRITYYITGHHPQVTAYTSARLAEDWDPAHPDENTAYYLRRLDEFAAKFSVFFTPEDFRRIFAPEDMFGFSSEGIRILKTVHTPARQEDIPF